MRWRHPMQFQALSSAWWDGIFMWFSCFVITVGYTAVENQHQHQWCLDKSALLFACKLWIRDGSLCTSPCAAVLIMQIRCCSLWCAFKLQSWHFARLKIRGPPLVAVKMLAFRFQAGCWCQVKFLHFSLLNVFCLSRKYTDLDMCILTHMYATIYMCLSLKRFHNIAPGKAVNHHYRAIKTDK